MKQFVKPKRQGEVIDTARMGKKTKITAETLKNRGKNDGV